jgi:hypothetical protein
MALLILLRLIRSLRRIAVLISNSPLRSLEYYALEYKIIPDLPEKVKSD